MIFWGKTWDKAGKSGEKSGFVFLGERGEGIRGVVRCKSIIGNILPMGKIA